MSAEFWAVNPLSPSQICTNSLPPKPVAYAGGATQREAFSRAKLIAAAPTMLAALRRAAPALKFAAEILPSNAMGDDYGAVMAAIAEATEVQP